MIQEELNQCDGCKRGLIVKDGFHYSNVNPITGIAPFIVMGCTKDRYMEQNCECSKGKVRGQTIGCEKCMSPKDSEIGKAPEWLGKSLLPDWKQEEKKCKECDMIAQTGYGECDHNPDALPPQEQWEMELNPKDWKNGEHSRTVNSLSNFFAEVYKNNPDQIFLTWKKNRTSIPASVLIELTKFLLALREQDKYHGKPCCGGVLKDCECICHNREQEAYERGHNDANQQGAIEAIKQDIRSSRDSDWHKVIEKFRSEAVEHSEYSDLINWTLDTILSKMSNNKEEE